MDWRQYIRSDPDILLGKPVVKGTRLTVDFRGSSNLGGCEGFYT